MFKISYPQNVESLLGTDNFIEINFLSYEQIIYRFI